MATKSARANNARLAELKKQQAAAERKRRVYIAGGASLVVLIIVIAVIVVAVKAPKGAVTSAKTSGSISDTLSTDLSTVPVASFNTVGVGSASASVVKQISGGTLLQKDGKPRIIYVGAEYCPYCASERWALATALGRFGKLTGLDYAVSSASDSPASIPTLSFKDAKYTSDVISFESYEVQDRDGKPLQTEPDDVKQLQQATGSTGIPFIYFAGKAYQSGSALDGTVFGDQPQDKIGTQVLDTSTDISKNVLGGANLLTAQICAVTDNKPADVCTSAGVMAAASAASSAASQ